MNLMMFLIILYLLIIDYIISFKIDDMNNDDNLTTNNINIINNITVPDYKYLRQNPECILEDEVNMREGNAGRGCLGRCGHYQCLMTTLAGKNVCTVRMTLLEDISEIHTRTKYQFILNNFTNAYIRASQFFVLAVL